MIDREAEMWIFEQISLISVPVHDVTVDPKGFLNASVLDWTPHM